MTKALGVDTRNIPPLVRASLLTLLESVAYIRQLEYTYIIMTKPFLDPKHFAALRQFKAETFKVLAHPTRIHVIETLRSEELSVNKILEEVKVSQANLSQHLTLLRQNRLVVTRKRGNQILYSLRDPLLIEVLDAMRQYFQKYSTDSINMLRQMK